MWEEFLQLSNGKVSISLQCELVQTKETGSFHDNSPCNLETFETTLHLCPNVQAIKCLSLNDLKYIESDGKDEVLGVQLWIRHAKVPDPSGALVEIPPT